MMIIGCDFHTRYQQIAMLDEATCELTERRLDHQSGEAEAFYRDLHGAVRVGIEATGPIRWFERLLAELGRAANPFTALERTQLNFRVPHSRLPGVGRRGCATVTQAMRDKRRRRCGPRHLRYVQLLATGAPDGNGSTITIPALWRLCV
jgi:hypothetical protein